MNLAEIVAAQAHQRPAHVALVQGDVEVTYVELDAMGASIGAWLLDHGVKVGDRVLFYSDNSIELLATYLGTARIGAIFVPINAGFKLREFSYVAKSAGAVIAFVAGHLLDEYARMESMLPTLPRTVVVVDGKSGEGRVDFRQIHTGNASTPIVDMDPESTLLISFTSGSTSHPKPVARSHGGETWSAKTYAHVWDYRPDDRALVALPLSWAYGLSTTTTAMLAAGSTVVLLTHFNPVRVLDTIERKAITLFAGTSTMFVKMLDVYRKAPTDLSSLRNCYVGGEPINRVVINEFEEVLGRRLWEGYASTEAFPILVTYPAGDAQAPRETCGRLVPDAEIRVVDADGNPVQDGDIGEAQFTCPGRMVAYYNEPGLTSERLTSDGWVRSGDLVRKDDAGFYFVVGRISEMIIRGGANIAPSEVESAIVAVAGVSDATVVSAPDDEYGEAVIAFVTTVHDGVDEATLRRHLETHLASYKIPSRFFFNVRLPSGITGKKDRRNASMIAEQLIAGV